MWNRDLVWLTELGSRSVSRWFSSNGVSSRTFRRRGAGRAHGWGRSCPGDGKRLCCILGAPRLCTLSLWPSLSPSLSLCLCARARRRHRRPFAFLFGFVLYSVSWLVQPGDFLRRLCCWWLTSDNKPLPPPPGPRFYPFGEVLTKFAYGWTDEEQGSKQGRGVVCETGHCVDSSFKICVHSAYSPLTPFPFVFFSFFWLRSNDKQRRCRVLRFLEFVCERREAQERFWRSFLYMEGIRVLM